MRGDSFNKPSVVSVNVIIPAELKATKAAFSVKHLSKTFQRNNLCIHLNTFLNVVLTVIADRTAERCHLNTFGTSTALFNTVV